MTSTVAVASTFRRPLYLWVQVVSLYKVFYKESVKATWRIACNSVTLTWYVRFVLASVVPVTRRNKAHPSQSCPTLVHAVPDAHCPEAVVGLYQGLSGSLLSLRVWFSLLSFSKSLSVMKSDQRSQQVSNPYRDADTFFQTFEFAEVGALLIQFFHHTVSTALFHGMHVNGPKRLVQPT